MCNLYSLTKGQDAIRQLTKAMRDTTGNLPPFPGSSHWRRWTGELWWKPEWPHLAIQSRLQTSIHILR